MKDDNDIDHLYEATQHVTATPYKTEHYLARAQAHALIAIGQELRRIREDGFRTFHVYDN